MAREAASTVAGKMLRVINTISDLARTGDGSSLGLAAFAELLGMHPDEVARLIRKINLGCGEALPELFVDFDEDAGTVTPHEMGFALDKPLRLSAAEARGLLTALTSAGIDQAEDVFQKIEGAFPPVDRAQFEAVRSAVTQSNQGSLLAALTRAVDARTPLTIAYRGVAEEAARERTVEPHGLGYDAREGAWYLTAFCRTAGGWRTFRVDRIEQFRALEGETFEQVDSCDAPHLLSSIDDAPMAVLAVRDPRAVSDAQVWRGMMRVDCPLLQDARRVAETPGAYIAAVPWSQGSPWLPRAIAQTLGGVEVIRPFELRALVAEAAQELLSLAECE